MSHSVLHPTLYTPATTSPNKQIALADGRVPGVWRVVLCTEDSVREDDVPEAIEKLSIVLRGMDSNSGVDTFIRARNPEVMAKILALPYVERIRGFVIPKADPQSFPLYANQVAGTDFRLMPILESPLMFNQHYRETLLSVLLQDGYRDMIDCLRIGANDLLGHLGIRRDDKTFTIYDTPVGNLIFSIINEFRGGHDFTITAPVFECYDTIYDQLLLKEVRQHILNGLFGQTIIHPRHIRLIRDAYKVSEADRQSAQGIVSNSAAVKGVNGKMDEYTTHIKWAQRTLERDFLFGDSAISHTLMSAISDEPVPVLA